MKYALMLGSAILASSLTAQAALTIHHNPFISAPTNFNGFESIGLHGFIYSSAPRPYTENGITVNYTGVADIYTPTIQTFQGPPVGEGNYVYGKSGYSNGYTDITFAPGAQVTAIQFLAGTNLGDPVNTYTDLAFQLFDHGSLVALGDAGPLGYVNSTLDSFGFSGITFDQVRLKAETNLIGYPADFSYIGTGSSDGLILDSIAVTSAPLSSAAPEPASWAAMLIGFGLLGATLRRKSATKLSFS